MAHQLFGEPALSAFLLSVLGDLAVIIGAGNTFFMDFNQELKKLKNMLFTFQDVLADAERRRLAEKSVDKWMDDLNGLLYDADDILDEIKIDKQELQAMTGSQSSNFQVSNDLFFSNVIDRSKSINSRIDKVLDTVGCLAQEADVLNLRRDLGRYANWSQSQATRGRETGPFIDDTEIYGRGEDKKTIIDMLLAEDGRMSKKNYDVICIEGMGGLGKTTLAQLVFQDQRVENAFQVKSWACVSDVFDVNKVMKELIDYAAPVNGMCNSQSLAALQAGLKSVVNKKRFLLVLDDVWSTATEWDKLIAPLNNCAKGSKILVTTRLKKVADAISNKKSYQLGLLGYDHCCAIFKDRAFNENYDALNQEELMKIGKEIVKNCDGVPLAVKVIGAMLRGAEEERWKAVLQSELWHSAYEREGIYPALRLSYYYLPPFLKRCFEFFATFPSNYRFQQDKLVRMWIAEGLVEVQEGRLLEDVGNQYYNDLKGRYLVQDNDKMHDMIHHLVRLTGGKFFHLAKSGSSSYKSLASVKHACFSDEVINAKKLDLLFDADALRTLICIGGEAETLHEKNWPYKMLRVLDLNSTYSFSDLPSFVGDMKHLRYLGLGGCKFISHLLDSICRLTNLQVLDLEGCASLQSLPQEIGNLSNLRFLKLFDTKISCLPESVCALHNLQILDLSHCLNLRRLPKDVGNLKSLKELKLWLSLILSIPESIVNLTGLRVLEVNLFCKLPASIGKLTGLEVLTIYHVGKEVGRGINELKDMNRLKGRLRIASMENIGSVEEASIADLKRKKHVEELELIWNKDAPSSSSTVRDKEMEMKIREALEPNGTLSYLSLFNFIGHKLPAWMFNDSSFCKLKDLKMISLQMMESIMGLELPCLKELIIKNCSVLRRVSMATPKLISLTIRNCRALKAGSLVLLPSLFDYANSSSLMHFINTPLLENLNCDFCYIDCFLQQPTQTSATNLLCTKLKTLWVEISDEDLNPSSLPRVWPSVLRSLEILKLENLPAANLQLLPSTDHRTGFPPSLQELHLINCQGLTCMPTYLCNFISLKAIFIDNCPGLVSLETHELPVPADHLELLSIRNCGNLRNLPDGLCNFASLECLDIYNCPNLEIRPHGHDLLPPKLAHIVVHGCPKLEEQLERENRADWQALLR